MNNEILIVVPQINEFVIVTQSQSANSLQINDMVIVTPSQGLEGSQGDKGDKGEQGIQGEKGDKGDIGLTGDQGIQGEKGDKGDIGEQGIQGLKGDTGEQGLKGDKGDIGNTGVGALIPTTVKTANYTAIINDLVRCDTAASVFTVTLPDITVDGASIGVIDVTNSFATHNLTLLPSGTGTIEGDTSFIFDIDSTYIELVCTLATNNWDIKATPMNLSLSSSGGGASSVIGKPEAIDISGVLSYALYPTRITRIDYATGVVTHATITSSSEWANRTTLTYN